MRLSPHFTLAEFTKTSVRGVSNQPPNSFIPKLKKLAECLEIVRARFGGKPIRINSGFRSDEVNRRIGGAKYSEHRMGCAVDFEIMGVDNREVWEWLQTQQIFTMSQCFLEYYDDEAGDPNSGWIHMAIPNPLRQVAEIG